MERIIGIYKILNKANGMFYIGSSNNIIYRWRGHKSELRGNYHANAHLQNAWNKYGEEAFEFIIIEQVNDLNKILETEDIWLNKTSCYDKNIGYNISGKAGRPNHSRETIEKIRNSKIGYKLSKQHKEKISKSLIGNKRTLGRKLTEEHKRKIGEVSRKIIQTEQKREKLRLANLGKKASAETREKLSISHLGNTSRPRRYTPEQIEILRQEKEAGISVKELSKKYNIEYSTIYYLIKRGN